jgi:hypothetical protein
VGAGVQYKAPPLTAPLSSRAILNAAKSKKTALKPPQVSNLWISLIYACWFEKNMIRKRQHLLYAHSL